MFKQKNIANGFPSDTQTHFLDLQRRKGEALQPRREKQFQDESKRHMLLFLFGTG